MSYAFLAKCVIVGETGVGKSCLLLQFAEKRFREDHCATIGAEFGTRLVSVDENKIKLQIWDMAGQESFRTSMRAYCHGAVGALLVYDARRSGTFASLTGWLEELRQHSGAALAVVLVGNKCDLEHCEVSHEQGLEFAQQNGLTFLETSAKTAHNVEEAFVQMARRLFEQVQSNSVAHDLGGSGQVLCMKVEGGGVPARCDSGCCSWSLWGFHQHSSKKAA